MPELNGRNIAINPGKLRNGGKIQSAEAPTVALNVYSLKLKIAMDKVVQVSTFDIASDSFTTLKDLLTKQKSLCAEFLERNYDRFFTAYQKLLASENYVVRRQSLKLLGEILLDRLNFNVMTKYISNPDNLKLMMNMLRDKSKKIQFEAFHVFKVFVANPNKPKPISEILLRNRDKLIKFLTVFHTDRTDDQQFNDEKAYLIQQIQEMEENKNYV